MAKPKGRYIYVVGGEKLTDGQVAIQDVDPEHPWVPSNKFAGQGGDPYGEHQVYVVKGDKKCGGAWAARTSEVQRKLSIGELEEDDAPDGDAGPMEGPPTESSERAAAIRDNKTPVATMPVSTDPNIEPNTSTAVPESNPNPVQVSAPSQEPVASPEDSAPAPDSESVNTTSTTDPVDTAKAASKKPS